MCAKIMIFFLNWSHKETDNCNQKEIGERAERLNEERGSEESDTLKAYSHRKQRVTRSLRELMAEQGHLRTVNNESLLSVTKTGSFEEP